MKMASKNRLGRHFENASHLKLWLEIELFFSWNRGSPMTLKLDSIANSMSNSNQNTRTSVIGLMEQWSLEMVMG